MQTFSAETLNRNAVKKMAEQRLIDANAAKKSLLSYYSFVNENTSKSNYTGETLMSYEVADMIEDCMDNAITINPETLPIVLRLREELKKANENYKANIALALSQRDEAIARAEKAERERDAAICATESLIHEYVRERELYMKWKDEQKEMIKNG